MINKKILLIDDSIMLHRLMMKFFTDLGIKLEVAANGAIGLEKTRSFQPDLILCDMHMPYKDGLAFLQDKWKDETIKNIPTIMLTVQADSETVKKAISKGALGYIRKPFDLNELMDTIRNIILLEKPEPKKSVTHLNVNYDVGIIFIEISGSLEKTNIIPLRYKIYELKKIYQIPKIYLFYMVHDIVESSISNASIHSLIDFYQDPELNIKRSDVIFYFDNIKIKNFFNRLPEMQPIVFVDTYLEGLKKLYLAPDDLKTISVSNIQQGFIPPGDLYDEKGTLIVEANKPVSEFDIQELKKKKISRVFYSIYDGMFFKSDEEVLTSESKTNEINELSGKSVLIIEDSKLMRFAIGKVFSKFGLYVIYAESAEEGEIKAFEFKPDIIVLDIILPGKSGVDFLTSFRKNNKSTPVVVMTGMSNRETVLKLKALGINGFITKPFKAEQLFKKISSILNPSMKI